MNERIKKEAKQREIEDKQRAFKLEKLKIESENKLIRPKKQQHSFVFSIIQKASQMNGT